MEQVSVCDQKPPKHLSIFPPFRDTSSQGSCKQFGPSSYRAEPMKIKFFCNFGGTFLPRPCDGEFRYVGGERHLLKINRDITWYELTCKTTKLIRQTHTVKYHLPGEQLNMLISITSDDDLRHMIDECIVLGANKERLTMYLFPDINDEHQVNFLVARLSTAEKEAQFIALVNGLIKPSDALRTQSLSSTSTNIPDQVMFGINEGRSLADRAEEVSLYIKGKPSHSIIAELQKPSSGQLENTLPTPSFLTRMGKKDYKVQSSKGNLITSGRNTTGALFGSSEPSEPMYVPKREPSSGQTVSRHQPELQRTATIMTKKGNQARATPGKGSSRNEILIPLGNNSNMNISSLNQNKSLMPHKSQSVYETPASLPTVSQETVNQQTISDSNKMKPRRQSTQEEGMSQSAAEPLRKNKNAQLQDKMGMPERTLSGTPMHCHGDISPNMHTLENSAATDSRAKHQPTVPTMCGNTSKKDHPSKADSINSETGLSSSFTSSDKTSDLKPNILVRALSERQQERSESEEQSSKLIKSRSVGADNNSPQIRSQSKEAKDNTAQLISEPEEHETKKGEQYLPKNAVLRRGLTSNVQIISNEDLEDLREMGSGAFGTVFHGKWKGTDVAIKRIKNSCFMFSSSQADKLVTEFWREAAIISQLHHPNILAFYGVVNNGPGGTLATVTEFMVNGSLKKVLLRKDKYLDWRRRLMLAMDAAIGMEYLHSKDIVHFDLKCDNLLVNVKDPSRPICKILGRQTKKDRGSTKTKLCIELVADFGLSKMKQATLVSGGMRGTLPWMAPELLTMNGTKVSEKVDVYSFGIVMWEIITGEDPYDGMHYGGVIGGILSNTLRPPVPTSCNPEWRKLMEQCWSTEPERRPSFTEVASRIRAILEASQSESPR
ncbi:hypothetical protein ACP4OV_012020 [Aristida adscensionis]